MAGLVLVRHLKILSVYVYMHACMYTCNCHCYDVYRDVHNVCSWDEKAPAKIQKGLESEILDFTKEVQEVRR